MVHFAPTWANDVYKLLKIHGDQKILIIANGTNDTKQPDLTELQPYLINATGLKNLISDEEFEWTKDSGFSSTRHDRRCFSGRRVTVGDHCPVSVSSLRFSDCFKC